jgi:HK97 gp10 family phage protein
MELHFDVVEDSVRRVKQAFLHGAADAMAKLALDTEAKAKMNITDQNAIDTGAARASIHTEFQGHSGYSEAISEARSVASKPGMHSGTPSNPQFYPSIKADELEAVVAVGVEYGALIELGTVHMSPRPFLEPAVNEVFGAAEGIIVEAINRRL